MYKSIAKTAGILALALFSSLALAHTGLKESTPADGSTVNEAPASIDLVFTGAVRLIKLEITHNGQVLETGFKPTADAMATYSIPTPGISAGSYSVNWAVIGADGHTVANTFSFSVDASAVAGSAP